MGFIEFEEVGDDGVCIVIVGEIGVVLFGGGFEILVG